MRGKDDVVEPGVGRVFGRLHGEHVERRAGNLAGLERGDERGLIHQFAARAIDDAHALLHGGQGFGVDDALGLRGEADVQGEIIGGSEELVHGDEADAVFAGHGGGDKGIAADDFEAETAGAARYFKPDAAEAEDAECLAAQLRRLAATSSPTCRRAWRSRRRGACAPGRS